MPSSLDKRQAEMRKRLSGLQHPKLKVAAPVVVAEPIIEEITEEPTYIVRRRKYYGQESVEIETTRRSLYTLVWREPLRDVAKRFGVSDVAVGKTCRRHGIPLPEWGHWNKVNAGKPVSKAPFPSRGFGQSDTLTIGGVGYYSHSDTDYLNDPVPPLPVFETSMDTVRSRVIALVNNAALPKRYGDNPHSQIAKLLGFDEQRRQKQQERGYLSSWDAPMFTTPFEQRRLNILHSLFVCLEQCGMRPFASDKQGRSLSVLVGDTHVSFTLEAVGIDKQLEKERSGWAFQPRDPKAKLELSISAAKHDGGIRHWQDRDGDRMENHLREIVVELIVAGEQNYRDCQFRIREWHIERKAELEEEERKRKIEEERKRREREAKLEKQRVEHLLGQADALHRAGLIRTYVAAVREANDKAANPMS